MSDILAGAVIIGIGFLMGGSVFLGEFSPLNFVFDGLGVVWIGKGIFSLISNSGAPEESEEADAE